MNLHQLIARSQKTLSDNSPQILTAFGAVGVLATAYLAVKASFRAYEHIQHQQALHDLEIKSHPYTDKEKFLMVWKFYIPTAVAAVASISAIILANRIGTRRGAALAVAYIGSERAFQEYREKVVEQIGKKKETAIRDEIAQEKVSQASFSNMMMIGSGEVLFMDARSGRTFNNTMEGVKHAINAINYKINGSVYASVNDLYEKVGLPRLPDGDDFGWTNTLLDVHFSTTIADTPLGQQPCFLMTFSVEPIRNYDRCFG